MFTCCLMFSFFSCFIRQQIMHVSGLQNSIITKITYPNLKLYCIILRDDSEVLQSSGPMSLAIDFSDSGHQIIYRKQVNFQIYCLISSKIWKHSRTPVY